MYEKLAVVVAFDGQHLQIRGRLGSLLVKRKETPPAWWSTFPLCTFEPAIPAPRVGSSIERQQL